MAQYRYLFADLTTNVTLAELPLTSVNFTQQLNTAGTFTGKLQISDISEKNMNIMAGTIPGRTALYIDRDGVIVWGGIIWQRDYASATQSLTLTGREFESYFERRRITTDTVFNSVDQLAIVQTLVNNAQLVQNGNIGILVGTETSGILVSKTYYAYEFKPVYTAIQDLSKAYQGFDFNVYCYYDTNGNINKLLRLGYPRYGKVYNSTSLTSTVFELPGNMAEYEYQEFGFNAANSEYALGAGSNEGKLIANAVDSTKINTGWPLLEDQINYSDVTDPNLLSSLATSAVNTISYPPQTLKIVLPTYTDPILGSYEIGDDARIRITDDRFPVTLDTVYRIIALNVQPGENGPDRVTVTLSNTVN